MNTDIEVVSNEKSLMTKDEERKVLSRVMEDAGLTDEAITAVLKDIIYNAVAPNPKTGEYYEDFSTRLSAIKTWQKFKSGNPDVQIQIANVFPGGNIL